MRSSSLYFAASILLAWSPFVAGMVNYDGVRTDAVIVLAGAFFATHSILKALGK